MSSGLTLEIVPDESASAAIAKAYKQHHKSDSNGAPAKTRKTRTEWNSPSTGAALEICRIEAKGYRDTFLCTGHPSDTLIGKRALSGNLINKVVPVHLDQFKYWLKTELPSLPTSALDAITEDHCRIQTIPAHIQFAFPTETDAFSAFLDLHRHCKVSLDSCYRMPTRTSTWKPQHARVLTPSDQRHAFTVLLPFGQVTIRVKRDFDDFPATFRKTEDADARLALASKLRCLLCFEVEVDLSKFYYVSDDLTFQLPTDRRDWTHAKLPDDPIKFVWDAVLYELWLNVPLLTTEPESESKLTWQLQEVLDAYLAGEIVLRHRHMGLDSKDFAKYREALINRARVDILTPWAISKLNLSGLLGPQLSYENRFDLRADIDLAPHTLTADTVDDAITEMDSAIQKHEAFRKKMRA
ncbi:MAG: hypothetical protein Q8N89_14610 [Azonexus sp.]|nr:hypothetical protein [Azonexus sp.]